MADQGGGQAARPQYSTATYPPPLDETKKKQLQAELDKKMPTKKLTGTTDLVGVGPALLNKWLSFIVDGSFFHVAITTFLLRGWLAGWSRVVDFGPPFW
jgi:hypothetical protein